jgi:hypothetical protein
MKMSEVKHKKLSSNPKALEVLVLCIKEGLTHKEIQQRLMDECGYKWTIDTIGRKCRAMGVSKKAGAVVNVDVVDSPMMAVPPYGLSDVEKAAWFREQFKKSHLYPVIKKQLEADEVIFYLNEFGHLCCQFQDIVVSEFMQIDDFLKHRILISRQLILAKVLQRELSELSSWFTMHPKKEDEDKDTARARMTQQRYVDDKHKQLKTVSDRYETLMKEHQKISTNLNATRKDRLDELKGGEATFLDLVGQLQHSEIERDRQGRFAELTKRASEDIKKEFRKPNEFPDGSSDPIIMDGDTNFGDDIDE